MSSFTPEQCRAGRAWLGLSQEEFAKRAKVGVSTLRDFEAGRREPIANNLDAIRRALETAGIELIEDANRTGVAMSNDARSELVASNVVPKTEPVGR